MKVIYKDIIELYSNDLNFKVMTQINSRIEVYQNTLSELEDTEMNKTLRFHFENSSADFLLLRRNVEESFKEYQDRISGCGIEPIDLVEEYSNMLYVEEK